jgi:hypothetical protein
VKGRGKIGAPWFWVHSLQGSHGMTYCGSVWQPRVSGPLTLLGEGPPLGRTTQ